MEEPLKARLIGASILVVLAVALVPELLSGPKNSAPGAASSGGAKGTRTVTIDLGGAVAAGAKLEPRPDTAPAPATPQALPTVETAAPGPASTTADVSAPTEETPPPEAVPVATPKPAPTPVPKQAQVQMQPAPATSRTPETMPSAIAPAGPAAAPVKGGFSVQVGAFGADATARKLVNDLKADGLPAYIAPLSKSGKTLYRVRVGPTADRAAADKLAAKLKARGLPVSVVSGG
jgi:DedD protein